MQEPLYVGKITLVSIWSYDGYDPNNDSEDTKSLLSCDIHQVSIFDWYQEKFLIQTGLIL
jgi:hypothetical protein